MSSQDFTFCLPRSKMGDRTCQVGRPQKGVQAKDRKGPGWSGIFCKTLWHQEANELKKTFDFCAWVSHILLIFSILIISSHVFKLWTKYDQISFVHKHEAIPLASFLIMGSFGLPWQDLNDLPWFPASVLSLDLVPIVWGLQVTTRPSTSLVLWDLTFRGRIKFQAIVVATYFPSHIPNDVPQKSAMAIRITPIKQNNMQDFYRHRALDWRVLEPRDFPVKNSFCTATPPYTRVVG